jgi:GPH family glycoside/pentoside/hexuronide:cation symporter
MLDAPRRAGEPPAEIATGLVIAWGSGSFCQAMVIYAYGVLFFRYLTDTVGISAAIVGTMIGASKLYDAIIDPTIGWLTDRFDTPMGRRRPWMLLGGVLMALSLAAGFNVPVDGSMTMRVTWATAALLLFSSGYSIFAIPWLSMPAEMTSNIHARTKMMAWRVGFSSLAQGSGTLAGPMLLSALGMTAMAYGMMGWIMAALCLGAALGTVFGTRRTPAAPIERDVLPPLGERLRMMLSNRPFVQMVLFKAVLYFGLAFGGAAMALMTRWVLGISDMWLGFYTLVTTLASLVSQPFWVALSRRKGKRFALSCGLAILTVAQISLGLNPGSPFLLLCQAGVLGVGSGGVYMLSQSLLPDVIEYEYRRSGMRRGGAFAGAISFLETGSSAIGIFIMGLVLSQAGYAQGLPTDAAQPDSAVLAIRLCVSAIPATMALLSLLVLSRYRLPS